MRFLRVLKHGKQSQRVALLRAGQQIEFIAEKQAIMTCGKGVWLFWGSGCHLKARSFWDLEEQLHGSPTMAFVMLGILRPTWLAKQFEGHRGRGVRIYFSRLAQILKCESRLGASGNKRGAGWQQSDQVVTVTNLPVFIRQSTCSSRHFEALTIGIDRSGNVIMGTTRKNLESASRLEGGRFGR